MAGSYVENKERMESIGNGKGINFIINEGYKVLGNPIAMFDTSYNLLTYVEDITTDDRLWNEIVSRGAFSHETVDFFRKEGFVAAFAQSEVVALLKSEKLKYHRANGKLFDNDGVQLANISVVACLKPFEQGDMELIEILCEILSVELQNSEFYHQIDRVYQESMLNDIIDWKNQDNEFIRAKIAELQKEFKGNIYLAVVDITQYDLTVTHLAYFRDLFRQMQPEHRYYIHLNNIVVIIDTGDSLLNIEKDLGKLHKFFKENNLYAGVSGAFQDILELRERHREAICALNYGLEGNRSRRIYKYDSFRVERLLNSVKNDAIISRIYSPLLVSIQEYDMENGTSLLKLLYTYLLYGKDLALTCEMLGITGDELNYRIETLSETFDIDWKDGDMLSNIFISIKILDDLLS